MELSRAQLQNIQALTVTSGKIKPENLPVGEQISVKIAAIDPESGEVVLKINDKLVSAKALLQLAAQLKVGQTLQLTVAQASANKISFQLPQTLVEGLLQQKSLREALPKQQPISDAIIQIKALIKNKKTNPLPAKIIQFAKNFISKLPTSAQLSTPEGVKQAIQQSGIFLEAKLANIIQLTDQPNSNNKNISNDIKALLLGFKNLLSKEKKTSEVTTNVTNKTDSKIPTALRNPADKQFKTETVIKQSTTSDASPVATKNKDLNQLVLDKLVKPLNRETTLDKNVTIHSKKTEDITLTGNTSIDKELVKTPLVAGKQIRQVLNNLLHPNKKPNSKTTLPPLSSEENNRTTKTQTPSTVKTAQKYAAKNIQTTSNEIALSTVKSQNVNEVTPPRMNNLIDLIETLIKQVDSAISRTQVHQLNTLIDQENNKLAMSLEIPVNDDDNLHLVQLHIEKEPNPENETETMVTVNLAIDLDAIGPVYARITLVNENTGVVLWAEHKTTFQLVEQNVNLLQTKLEASGLKPDNIACHHGQPPQSQFIATDKNTNLLDVRA